ncbi:MAG TPA: hypothetical protein VGB85_16135 [Nannocystis sp.]|jgi:hypothetical protein
METHDTASDSTARPSRETEEDVDLVVIDIRVREPGFYTNRTRTYFVAQDGAVYLVCAPGQPATLQREDDLPPDCDPGVVVDEVLALLGEAADMVGRRGLGQRNTRPLIHLEGTHDPY